MPLYQVMASHKKSGGYSMQRQICSVELVMSDTSLNTATTSKKTFFAEIFE
jgi:hypothetical protein